MYIIFRYRLTL